MRRFALLAALLLPAPLLSADPPKKEEPKKEDTTTKVTGTFSVPKDHPSLTKLVLEVRLYEYDPRIADTPATLIEKVEKKDFSHAAGKETVEAFEVGSKGELKSGKSYYLTVYVMDGDKRVSRGELSHDKGLGKVLTGGHPREVKAVARSLEKK